VSSTHFEPGNAPNERMQLTWLLGAPGQAASVHQQAVGRIGLGSSATQLMRAVRPQLPGGVDLAVALSGRGGSSAWALFGRAECGAGRLSGRVFARHRRMCPVWCRS